MRLRIKFRKFGPVRYIGHLDVMRFFQKAIRRAEIDVAYTEGFSPHQIMTFASPLGVGLESDGEYMDIEVNSMSSCRDIADRLNAASVPGIEIASVRVLPDNAGNAMASVAAAAYRVSFREESEPSLSLLSDFDRDMGNILQTFLSREHIFITKKTKKGARELDIRPGIYELTWENGAFHMLLNASSAGNIKPVQVMEALLKPLPEGFLRIVREDVYTNTGTEESPVFTSLGEIGGNE